MGLQEEEVSEGTLLDRLTRVDSPDVESSRFSPHDYDFEDFSVPETVEPITGKLKYVCPMLFHSLTTWEKNILDDSSFFGPR
jgi:hypothetical protein